MKRFTAVLWLSLISWCSLGLVKAQDAASLVESGDAAAHDDRHAEAISAYQQAIRLDPSSRSVLLPKLAQQYLWSEKAATAINLFAEYLQGDPKDCDARMSYALALAWGNRLEKASREYQEVARLCPEQEVDARLGEAKVLRWMDRYRKADAAYGDVLWNKDPWREHDAQQLEAAHLGLAQDSLATDDNRAAHQMFTDLIKSGSKDPGAYQGQAVSALHLGIPDQALASLQLAKQAGVSDQSLDDLEAHVRGVDRPTLSPSVTGFDDGDGTTYRAAEVTGAFSWNMRARTQITTGASRLTQGDQIVDARWGGVAIEQRFNPSWAARAESRITEYPGTGFRPVTGEFNAIWTPRDGSRVDFAMARVQESDNMAALRNRLQGTFLSVGTDERITDHESISISFDDTHWNQGSIRKRYRVSPSHHFEGLHGITVALPSLFQTYNHGFSFLLFSPRRYAETGPEVSWSRWYQRHWQLSFKGRLGAQKESDQAWKGLGTVETQLDRELWKAWGFRAAASWSSSSLASPTGFRRLSFSVGLDLSI